MFCVDSTRAQLNFVLRRPKFAHASLGASKLTPRASKCLKTVSLTPLVLLGMCLSCL
nr:MAG TPA: hypothetical protein [Caudoviricetes sp.]